MFTQEYVKSIIYYDSISGELLWKVNRGRAKAGKRAGGIGAKGHRYIKIGNIETTASRIVWLYVYGELPETHLWHINGDHDDCRIENLRIQKQDDSPLTQERLKQVLYYDNKTGEFTWRENSSKSMSNKAAGFLNDQGYILIGIGNDKYRAHRLAWLYVYGEWPQNDLDHINGIKTDNFITNLREATDSQNLSNSKKPKTNKSGFKGVSWHSNAKKWQSHIRVNGKSIYLGLFQTPEKAHQAYRTAARKYKGDFARNF